MYKNQAKSHLVVAQDVGSEGYEIKEDGARASVFGVVVRKRPNDGCHVRFDET